MYNYHELNLKLLRLIVYTLYHKFHYNIYDIIHIIIQEYFLYVYMRKRKNIYFLYICLSMLQGFKIKDYFCAPNK